MSEERPLVYHDRWEAREEKGRNRLGSERGKSPRLVALEREDCWQLDGEEKEGGGGGDF